MNDPIETIPGELNEIHLRLNAGEKRMQNIERALEDNTAITRDIKDILDAARVGFKVLGGLGAVFKWAGIVAGALVAIWSFILAVSHGAPTK